MKRLFLGSWFSTLIVLLASCSTVKYDHDQIDPPGPTGPFAGGDTRGGDTACATPPCNPPPGDTDCPGCNPPTGCSAGHLLCSGSCRPCPLDPAADGFACDMGACAAVHCTPSFHFCLTGCCSWSIDTVAADPTDEVGWQPSVAVDPDDNPVIVYRDFSNGVFRIARHDGSDWSDELVDQFDRPGIFNSLVITGDGRLHVSYTAGITGDLKYATRTINGWEVETVRAAAGDYYSYTSMQIINGITTLVHTGQTALHVARKSNGPWLFEEIAAGANLTSPSLVVDKGGKAHVVFYERALNTVWYGYEGVGGWAFDEIEVVGEWGFTTDLGIDGAGTAHVVYQDHSTNAIKYARGRPGDWTSAVLGVGGAPSLAVDGNNRPHVGFSGTAGVTYTRQIDGAWEDQSVDPDFGDFVDLALDRVGGPHLAWFWTQGGFELRYAR